VKTLTVTEAAKNLPACLKRVYYKHESYELIKNGVPYARLVPPNGASCNTHELADDVDEVKFSAEDRRTLASAIRKGRKTLKSLKNPWD
jgi:antitoxin (DNA-binding transcriptional repressor) of toxin-antitoxin stability system